MLLTFRSGTEALAALQYDEQTMGGHEVRVRLRQENWRDDLDRELRIVQNNTADLVSTVTHSLLGEDFSGNSLSFDMDGEFCYLFINLSVCLPAFLSVCLSAGWSFGWSSCLSVCLSIIYVSIINVCICLSIYLFIIYHRSIFLSISLFLSLWSNYPSVQMSIYLSCCLQMSWMTR